MNVSFFSLLIPLLFSLNSNANEAFNKRKIYACNSNGKVYQKNYLLTKQKLKNNNIKCVGRLNDQTTIHGKAVSFYAASNSCVSNLADIQCRKAYNETKISICNFLFDHPELIENTIHSNIEFGIAYSHQSANVEGTIFYAEQISKILHRIDLEELPYANFYPYNIANSDTSPIYSIELGANYNPCFLKEYLKLMIELK